MLPDHVQRKLANLPAAPGVYVFEDRSGAVLYVGKARSLRSRVRSYFTASHSDDRFFIASLQHELGDLSTVVVGNEKEAALLENELIKQHQPRYNVKLRDDKDFLSIKIDPSEKWPRLRVVRRPKPDGARYYGPYESATSARQTLRQINRYFRLRTCKEGDFRSRTRPCLQYQIKRCPAPCVMDVARDEYLAQVDLVGLFLDGRHDELSEDLERRMRDAAEDLRFEEAATYRDQLRQVERARTTQRIAKVTRTDQDVFGMHRAGDQAEVAVLRVRGGHLNHVRTFALKQMTLPDDELLSSFLGEYYQVSGQIPDEVLLPTKVEASKGIEDVLSDERGKRVQLLFPQRGARVRLLEMARENAEHAYREKARQKEDLDERLAKIQRRLRLPAPPRRIECVDISHLGGADTVAAIAALRDGELDKTRYRTFKLKRARGGDDFAAMHEVLSRRLRRGRDADAGWELPDLLVVDGGKGQLNVATAVLSEIGVTDLPVVGLAKERSAGGETTAVERVFLPGQKNAIALPARSPSRYFLARVRDEAHRTSNRLREKVGKRRRMKSGLDDVPGVGPKTKKALLLHFGTLKKMRAASLEQLREGGANRKQAEALFRRFHGRSSDEAADAERAALENAFEV